MANGLLLSLAVLESGPSGPVPQPAQLGILTNDGTAWSYRFIEDEDSNVFHKAMVFAPAGGEAAILTAGGTKAMVKLWKLDGSSSTLWEQDFGGKFSRMRDVEVADINGDGFTDIVVATHDQGVVAVLYGDAGGGYTAASSTPSPTPSSTRSRSAISTATACSRSTPPRACPTSSTARRSPAL